MEERPTYRVTIGSADVGPDIALAFVEAWLERPELRHLVEQAGGSWPADGLAARLEALHDFSERWDFRRGGERLQIDRDAPSGIPSDEIMASAGVLGMATESTPESRSYDHAIVLGGTALANLNRLRYLRSLMAEGLSVGHVAALTALRELQPNEIGVVRDRPDLSPFVGEATTEFDVFVAAASQIFGGDASISYYNDENPNLRGARAEIGAMSILAAPSADPSRRANTRDNYLVYADEIQDGQSVLIVTSSIYLPYQFFVGLRALGLRRTGTVEAVGFPPEWMQGVLTGPTNVLQELRSAFFGALELVRNARWQAPRDNT